MQHSRQVFCGNSSALIPDTIPSQGNCKYMQGNPSEPVFQNLKLNDLLMLVEIVCFTEYRLGCYIVSTELDCYHAS